MFSVSVFGDRRSWRQKESVVRRVGFGIAGVGGKVREDVVGIGMAGLKGVPPGKVLCCSCARGDRRSWIEGNELSGPSEGIARREVARDGREKEDFSQKAVV
jgi:hypothetical protein